MDLWIRSQDKKLLMKSEKIMIEEGKDVFAILNYIDTKNWFKLGVYKTKERALEVLDEIQDLLQNAYVGNLERIVYQMPEE